MKIVYLYDENSMIGMLYTTLGVTKFCYFQRNLQGDVVGIYDENGTLKVKYNYDAWGNCTISSETTDYPLAHANPIRYRGYYYDEDTGLYYLNTRYYSPLWRRFISPDDTVYIDPESVNGLNLYAYCNNNPVMNFDPNGTFVISLTALLTAIAFGAIAGGAIATASVAYQDYKDDGKIFNGSIKLEEYFAKAVGGMIAGAGIGVCTVLGAGVGVAVAATESLFIGSTAISFGSAFAIGIGAAFVTGGLGYSARTAISEKETFEFSDMFIEAGANAFSGMLSFAGGVYGGATGFKVPGKKGGFTNFLLYQASMSFLGVYVLKIAISIIKNRLKEMY